MKGGTYTHVTSAALVGSDGIDRCHSARERIAAKQDRFTSQASWTRCLKAAVLQSAPTAPNHDVRHTEQPSARRRKLGSVHESMVTKAGHREALSACFGVLQPRPKTSNYGNASNAQE